MATFTDFEAILTEFKERTTGLVEVIVKDLEDLNKGKYGCKTASVAARNKLKELIDISRRLKSASLAKSKALPKRVNKKKNVKVDDLKPDEPKVDEPKEHELIENESADILEVTPLI
jgi:hypothetical protein